jgi:hypothetical protein
VHFVCPFCRGACCSTVAGDGQIGVTHAEPLCIERASSSAVDFLRAVRSKLGGDS